MCDCASGITCGIIAENLIKIVCVCPHGRAAVAAKTLPTEEPASPSQRLRAHEREAEYNIICDRGGSPGWLCLLCLFVWGSLLASQNRRDERTGWHIHQMKYSTTQPPPPLQIYSSNSAARKPVFPNNTPPFMANAAAAALR